MSKKNGYQAVVEALVKEKVKYFFGLPGNPRAMYEQLYYAPEVKPILVRHQTSGVLMAMAYARVSGEVGVCFGSPGPGVANLVPGFLEAYYTCTPLVSPSAYIDLNLEGQAALQECDQVGMLRPLTKWSARVPVPEKIPWFMRRAFSLAMNGKPGPVFLEIPYNIGFAEADFPEYTPATKVLLRGDSGAISRAADLILQAERPVLIAGNGVMLARAQNALIDFVEMLGIPVMTTPCGRGAIPEDHPLSIGEVGIYRSNLGKRVEDESDLLITVGSRNEELETAGWKLFPAGAKFIQIDIDPFEIGRNWIPTIPIVGDAGLVLLDLLEVVKTKATKKFRELPRIQSLIKARKEYEAQVDEECRTDAVPIMSKRLVKEINRAFGENTILCNENGMQDVWSYYFPYYKVLNGSRALAPADQTLMGTGVVGAIGAKLAAPDKKVVCTSGDGAFQMFMKELPTAVQYKTPVTWVIFNNYSLGWPKYYQKLLGDRYIATDFEVQPDFVKIAEANKCHGEHVEKPGDVKNALMTAIKQNNAGIPAVVDVVIEPWDNSEGFKDFFRILRGIEV